MCDVVEKYAPDFGSYTSGAAGSGTGICAAAIEQGLCTYPESQFTAREKWSGLCGETMQTDASDLTCNEGCAHSVRNCCGKKCCMTESMMQGATIPCMDPADMNLSF